MSYTLIICLIIIGFILLTLEILVFPGTSVAGILGLGALVFSVYETFATHGNTAGWIMLSCVLAASIVLIIFLLRSKTWKKLQLDTSLDGKVNVEAEKLQVGQKGLAVSRLAPMGTIEVDGTFYEAQSVLDLIDQKTPVQVVKIEGSKIWVQACPPKQASTSGQQIPASESNEQIADTGL